jgi:hypothetical protein
LCDAVNSGLADGSEAGDSTKKQEESYFLRKSNRESCLQYFPGNKIA